MLYRHTILRDALSTIRNVLNFGLRHRWVKVGKKIRVQWNVRLWAPNGLVVIGDYSAIGSRCVITTDTLIGKHALFAAEVAIVGRDAHTYKKVGQTMLESPRADRLLTIIEDDVWVGYRATIVSGVRVGMGSIIAAGALVVRDVQPFTIVGGAPAKQIGWRFVGDEEQQRHIEVLKSRGLFSDFSEAEAKFQKHVAAIVELRSK